MIIDNGANLNNHLMKDICEQFKITHKNSTAYQPQVNGAIEAAIKNIKRILRKTIDNYKNWHEQLPYALLGYRTTTRTSTGATPYLLVYGTEAVIPVEVEIPSLRIIQEAELNDAEWVKNRYEKLAMIDKKRMVADSCTDKECLEPSTSGSEPDFSKLGNLCSNESSPTKKNTKENSRRIGKDSTWSGKCFQEES
ncbi:uncharacterized protein LOC132066091 [Lycium ferocissimum]|uniref:uncharacterized protein LOC132066091 n=1 Tax=Lycium ferocissimum TaxID=112874 RepID=UPI0028152CE6|nr:uncharacterized protein LOC132066091 [Lycium ferocissimum]